MIIVPLLIIALATPAFAEEVLWDLSHGISGDYHPDGDYSVLVAILERNGFTVSTTEEGIANIDLTPYGILVINLGEANYPPYSPEEVVVVIDFIATGGGVFVMAENPDSWNEQIAPITEAFGITVGLEYLYPLDYYFDDLAGHPVFDGVSQVYYRAGGSVHAVAFSIEIAYGPEGLPVVAALEPCGLLVTGDSNFCTNEYIVEADNEAFSLNIFNWLAIGDVATEESTWSEVKALYR
jgi:hypothetical protein